jgi:NAD-dependent deacetylase sirtuin 4
MSFFIGRRSLAFQWSLPHRPTIATRYATSPASSRSTKYSAIYSSHRILPLERPQHPNDISEASYVKNQAEILRDWMSNKQSILCLTGAGMSTESGIPDYRGNNGSYHRGHKPIIHHEFMSSEQQRKRYWGRSLVGYSPFANAKPNLGHKALAALEEKGWIGVDLKECTAFDSLGESCFGNADRDETRRISIITQNVDSLHSKAGVQNILHLHGRGDLVRCMNCGTTRDRIGYHDQLIQWNQDWYEKVTAVGEDANDKKELRPDGDAELGGVQYEELILPPCPNCGGKSSNDTSHDMEINGNHQQEEEKSFFKTDVVFFGDSVPRHRFDISHAAVDFADGVLCIGTSLAVHSAFRLVKRAIEQGTPVAILNVGTTRVEREGLGEGLVTKLESPIGETLAELVNMLD